jgi:hypothetical protein
MTKNNSPDARADAPMMMRFNRTVKSRVVPPVTLAAWIPGAVPRQSLASDRPPSEPPAQPPLESAALSSIMQWRLIGSARKKTGQKSVPGTTTSPLAVQEAVRLAGSSGSFARARHVASFG